MFFITDSISDNCCVNNLRTANASTIHSINELRWFARYGVNALFNARDIVDMTMEWKRHTKIN